KEVRIKASPAAVWKALTEADELVKWFPTEARVKPGLGGGIWLSWGPGMEGGEGKILVWEPGRHLRKDGKSMSGQPLTVDFYIETEGGETVVRLVHSGFGTGAGWDDEYDSIDTGWGLYMKNLRHYLERHAGERCLHRWTPVPMKVSLAEGWQRLVGPEGLAAKGSLPLEKNARFSIETADGTKLEGLVEVAQQPSVLALTVTTLNDALLRFTMMEMGVCFASLDFFAFGVAEAQAVAVHDALIAICKKAFAPGARK
ncbi:MAG TPA: SRPBCC domain-containing protein, partial [Planctomycetota bacterium]|nr:SRPBCC domain-containing protein [Planctomycetota bacterium]